MLVVFRYICPLRAKKKEVMKNGGMDQYMYRTDMWNVVWRMCIGNGGVVSAFMRDASRASVRWFSGPVCDNDGKVEVKKNDECI
jgi:hypothetical protein